MATEAEAVGEEFVDALFAGLKGDVVEVASGVGVVEIGRRVQHSGA